MSSTQTSRTVLYSPSRTLNPLSSDSKNSDVNLTGINSDISSEGSQSSQPINNVLSPSNFIPLNSTRSQTSLVSSISSPTSQVGLNLTTQQDVQNQLQKVQSQLQLVQSQLQQVKNEAGTNSPTRTVILQPVNTPLSSVLQPAQFQSLSPRQPRSPLLQPMITNNIVNSSPVVDTTPTTNSSPVVDTTPTTNSASMAETPVTMAETPVTMAETPVTMAETPVTMAETPVTTSENISSVRQASQFQPLSPNSSSTTINTTPYQPLSPTSSLDETSSLSPTLSTNSSTSTQSTLSNSADVVSNTSSVISLKPLVPQINDDTSSGTSQTNSNTGTAITTTSTSQNNVNSSDAPRTIVVSEVPMESMRTTSDTTSTSSMPPTTITTVNTLPTTSVVSSVTPVSTSSFSNSGIMAQPTVQTTSSSGFQNDVQTRLMSQSSLSSQLSSQLNSSNELLNTNEGSLPPLIPLKHFIRIMDKEDAVISEEGNDSKTKDQNSSEYKLLQMGYVPQARLFEVSPEGLRSEYIQVVTPFGHDFIVKDDSTDLASHDEVLIQTKHHKLLGSLDSTLKIQIKPIKFAGGVKYNIKDNKALADVCENSSVCGTGYLCKGQMCIKENMKEPVVFHVNTERPLYNTEEPVNLVIVKFTDFIRLKKNWKNKWK
jgi:hypothetical protein